MSLRDPEFRESLEGFHTTSQVHPEPRLPHSQVSPSSFPNKGIHLTWGVADACRHHAVSGADLSRFRKSLSHPLASVHLQAV